MLLAAKLTIKGPDPKKVKKYDFLFKKKIKKSPNY